MRWSASLLFWWMLALPLSAGAVELTAPERLDVTPGLPEEWVLAELVRRQPQLLNCVRDDVPEVPYLDDRVLIAFTINERGEVRRAARESPRIVGTFIDRHCADEIIEAWRFVPLVGVEEVRVSAVFRVRTTPQERKASRDRIAEELQSYCQSFQRAVRAKKRDPLQAALREVMNERQGRLSRTSEMWMNAALNVNPVDQGTIILNAFKELGAECPQFEAHGRQSP
ncbi:hypothetical protein [Myxococcus sp. RHSTA-1-4]|uniref:hypothetical protein n=1 Tax=Myxococcus sp. RHSTA-1-4 TaxID=2874601 RepID=UPI001CBCF575|nr:hypothetical protein [Myxococcus sp. RHSTA-1-4]MBZ4420417.1 hypothetical protein [Myxococcus sp. RHSTA-1-4]